MPKYLSITLIIWMIHRGAHPFDTIRTGLGNILLGSIATHWWHSLAQSVEKKQARSGINDINKWRMSGEIVLYFALVDLDSLRSQAENTARNVTSRMATAWCHLCSHLCRSPSNACQRSCLVLRKYMLSDIWERKFNAKTKSPRAFQILMTLLDAM